MTKEVVEGILDEVGIGYAYHHFEPEEAIAPPFICWLVPGCDNFAADGKVFFSADEVHIELYTDRKDFELEQRVEEVLNKREIYWGKSEEYIENEDLYEVRYELMV